MTRRVRGIRHQLALSVVADLLDTLNISKLRQLTELLHCRGIETRVGAPTAESAPVGGEINDHSLNPTVWSSDIGSESIFWRGSPGLDDCRVESAVVDGFPSLAVHIDLCCSQVIFTYPTIGPTGCSCGALIGIVVSAGLADVHPLTISATAAVAPINWRRPKPLARRMYLRCPRHIEPTVRGQGVSSDLMPCFEGIVIEVDVRNSRPPRRSTWKNHLYES